ncbi:hypothetical protein [Streptomyces sp. NPDC059928]|uniref:hypothetical protein n=1 Tax=unclassified Streptomyces TaxID=2593676 RepID=UPI0036694BB2
MTIPSAPASHRLYLSQLALYLRDSRLILTTWDAYSARHSDPVTNEPYDEDAYGRRQRERDADTLAAFGRVYYHAHELVEVAEQQLAQVPVSDRTRHYTGQVRELQQATEGLYAVHADWRAVREALPTMAKPGTAAYEDPLAESHAEAWHYLDQWTAHGQALFAVNALAQRQSLAGAPVAGIVAPAPASAASVRR